jgi:hypothetical protein
MPFPRSSNDAAGTAISSTSSVAAIEDAVAEGLDPPGLELDGHCEGVRVAHSRFSRLASGPLNRRLPDDDPVDRCRPAAELPHERVLPG